MLECHEKVDPLFLLSLVQNIEIFGPPLEIFVPLLGFLHCLKKESKNLAEKINPPCPSLVNYLLKYFFAFLYIASRLNGLGIQLKKLIHYIMILLLEMVQMMHKTNL